MIVIFLFGIAMLAAVLHILISKQQTIPHVIEIVLAYVILFNIGVMGILAFYGHTFMSEEVARKIGWAPGSPFQYEVAVANLAFGILGLAAFRYRELFWVATVVGSSIFLLGAFVVHIFQYFFNGNSAPYNFGIFVWVNDLLLPIICLALLWHYITEKKLLF